MADLLKEVGVAMMSDCWLWPGAVDRWGYAHSRIGSRTDGSRCSALVHRAAYEVLVGPIPEGLTLDHLCRTPHCYNPRHLEPVTMRVNTMRGRTVTAANAAKTECPKCGGAFTERPNGTRYCRPCYLAYLKAYNAERDGPVCSRKVGVR